MAQSGATITTSEGGFLDRFPWYVQLLVLLAVILLVVFLVDFFKFRGWRTDAEKKDQEAQTLRRENQEADVVRANIIEYQKRLDEQNAKLDRLKVSLPEEREVTNIFDSAKSMMDNNTLRLVQFETSSKDKEVASKFYTEVSSNVKVTGSYRDVQTLFQKLSAFERIVNVTDINLKQADPKDQAAGASTQATFRLTAFYISDANRKALEESDDAAKNPKAGNAPPKKK